MAEQESILSKKLTVFTTVTLIGLIFDQATKIWIRNSETINNGGWKIIPGFLDFVHAENPGAAFGLLSDFPEVWRLTLFLSFTVIAIFVILDLYRRLPRSDVFMTTTLGLILSGALGNAIDRIHQSTVTDFIRIYTDHPPWVEWLGSHWPYMTEYPSFNIADSALLIGVGMFLFHYLFLEEKEQEAEEVAAEANDQSSEESDLETQETDESAKPSAGA